MCVEESRQLGSCTTALLAPRNRRRRPAVWVQRVAAERRERGIVGEDADGWPGAVLRKFVGKATAEW